MFNQISEFDLVDLMSVEGNIMFTFQPTLSGLMTVKRLRDYSEANLVIQNLAVPSSLNKLPRLSYSVSAVTQIINNAFAIIIIGN